ncbi:hypothetical protein HMI55_005571 [Coelomomyces lativittatus]|nr:hypothetical protein HMI55_005571 [Coelomomyces lativittatus]
MASKAKQQPLFPYQHQHQQNHSEHTDLVPLNVPNELTQEWSKPSSEECAQITDKTKAIFEKKLQSISTPSLANSSSSNQSNAPKFIKYTPHAQQQGKIIQLVEMPKEPLEPPKFGF